MKYIFVFISLFYFFQPVYAQQETAIDNPNGDKTILENGQEVVEENADKQEAVEQASEAQVSESDFDVFRPSEDISEDLAVPFPVDI